MAVLLKELFIKQIIDIVNNKIQFSIASKRLSYFKKCK